MKREAPTEREIAELFGMAYDKGAEPDARRLAAIEQRLLERPRRRVGNAWWWLFAVLATGAASALWWSVNYDSGDASMPPEPGISAPPVVPTTVEPAANPARPDGAAADATGKPAPKQGPIIYQRR